ncbi:MAG: aspartate carbamoyltransferase catalytic subunit, partial [Mariprofundus sp.]|nr:aspartate carbamoyltransferase catalytic subunit [Mariprofundus sp.]
YHEAYGLNRKRLKAAAEGCLVMHPGPMNRGVEIATDVADSARALILDQVEHGVAIRMAVLTALCGGQQRLGRPGPSKKMAMEAMHVQGSLL